MITFGEDKMITCTNCGSEHMTPHDEQCGESGLVLVPCSRCKEQHDPYHLKYNDREAQISLYLVGGVYLCRSCCIETDHLPEGYAFSKNCLSGNKIMIRAEDKGVPHLDPAYERYHCM